MTDCNLRFVVTNPIHMEAMKVRRKVREQAKRQSRVQEQPYIKQKHTRIQFKCDFCEKTTKTALKNGLNINLGNILFVYLRGVKWNDPDKKSVKIDRNIMLFDYGS